MRNLKQVLAVAALLGLGLVFSACQMVGGSHDTEPAMQSHTASHEHSDAVHPHSEPAHGHSDLIQSSHPDSDPKHTHTPGHDGEAEHDEAHPGHDHLHDPTLHHENHEPLNHDEHDGNAKAAQENCGRFGVKARADRNRNGNPNLSIRCDDPDRVLPGLVLGCPEAPLQISRLSPATPAEWVDLKKLFDGRPARTSLPAK